MRTNRMGSLRVLEIIVLTVCASVPVACGESEPVNPVGSDGTSVVMTRLLRFNERAEGLEEDPSRIEAYHRYSEPLLRILEDNGGRLLWSGSAGPPVIGESQEPFHEIVVVEYPSVETYLELLTDERVAANDAYRQAGLACQWFIPGVTEDAVPGEVFSVEVGRATRDRKLSWVLGSYDFVEALNDLSGLFWSSSGEFLADLGDR